MLRILGILAALIVLAGCSSSSGGGGAEPDTEDGYMAQVMCEEFVKDRLKSPGSADFSNAEHVETAKQRWDVTGVVGSENGFGALLRSSSRCDLRYMGNDNWRVKSVEVG